jgi:hypothetical protein
VRRGGVVARGHRRLGDHRATGAVLKDEMEVAVVLRADEVIAAVTR